MKYLISLVCLFLLTSSVRARALEVDFETNSSLPLVYINLVLKAGSVHDPASKTGLANFMAEMMLKGTKSRSKEQIDLALDQMGAVLGVETRAEALVFRGAVLASQLDNFLELFTDVVTNPSFPEKEFGKLKSEVVSGILEETGQDSTLASLRGTQFLFQGHPYGNPVIGKQKDIEQLKRADVLAHYKAIFRESHLLIVGTGDTSIERINNWADQLKSLLSGKAVGVEQVAAPKQWGGRRLLLVDKPDRTQTQIVAGQIGIKMTDPNYFPLYLVNYVFGGGSFSSRLMVEIRVKKGWSYGAGSGFRQGLQPRSWTARLFPASKDTPAALARTLELIEELKDKGITQEEYQFGINSLVNSAGFTYNTPAKRVENTILEKTLELPKGFMKTYASELSKVSIEKANAAAREYFQPENLAITVVGTASQLRTSITNAAKIKDSQVTVLPYQKEL